ncbi:MAG: HD-GYP domain-containing protein [Fibrobacterota bacterium]
MGFIRQKVNTGGLSFLNRHPVIAAASAGTLIHILHLFLNPYHFSEILTGFRYFEMLQIFDFLEIYIVIFILLLLYKKSSDKSFHVKVREGLQQVKEVQNVSILGFTKITEVRDPVTGDHVVRIAHYSKALAQELAKIPKYSGYITDTYIEEMFISAPLHDVGKIGIKDEVLLKEGKLSEKEFEIMKMHTIIGGNIISELERKLKFTSFFTLGKEIAYHHHQKYNGTGYPNIFRGNILLVEKGVGVPLKGEEIPLSARIVALADVYDALTTKRPYKEAFPHQKAKSIIVNESGKHFDPEIVKAFLRIEDIFIKIRTEHAK